MGTWCTSWLTSFSAPRPQSGNPVTWHYRSGRCNNSIMHKRSHTTRSLVFYLSKYASTHVGTSHAIRQWTTILQQLHEDEAQMLTVQFLSVGCCVLLWASVLFLPTPVVVFAGLTTSTQNGTYTSALRSITQCCRCPFYYFFHFSSPSHVLCNFASRFSLPPQIIFGLNSHRAEWPQ